MKKIIFLRGIIPTGTNRIPQMSYLVETLTELSRENFGEEESYDGHACCYLYLPCDARKNV